MEKIIYGQSVEKGRIIEITVPNVKKPIKAVVLDVIGYCTGGNSAHYECILYAQKRLFKASFEHDWSIEDSYDDDDIPETVEVHWYSKLNYGGIIIDYCEIPGIPSDI